jgi:hypothetical protein
MFRDVLTVAGLTSRPLGMATSVGVTGMLDQALSEPFEVR